MCIRISPIWKNGQLTAAIFAPSSEIVYCRNIAKEGDTSVMTNNQSGSLLPPILQRRWSINQHFWCTSAMDPMSFKFKYRKRIPKIRRTWSYIFAKNVIFRWYYDWEDSEISDCSTDLLRYVSEYRMYKSTRLLTGTRNYHYNEEATRKKQFKWIHEMGPRLWYEPCLLRRRLEWLHTDSPSHGEGQ